MTGRPDRPVVLAAVAGAHGITGEVRLKLFSDLAGLSAQRRLNGGALTLAGVREHRGGAIARFAEVADRDAAEALRGTELWVPRHALPALEPGEYYHADLIGLTAETEAGEPLGEVVAVHNYGAGDIVEIAREHGGRLLVPLSREAVPEWDDERLLVSGAYAE